MARTTFSKGPASGGGEHSWVDASTLNDRAEGQTVERCTRCSAARVTKHGESHGDIGPCPKRHPDDHTI